MAPNFKKKPELMVFPPLLTSQAVSNYFAVLL